MNEDVAVYIIENYGEDFFVGLLIGSGQESLEGTGMSREFVRGIQSSFLYSQFIKETKKSMLCDDVQSQIEVGQKVMYKRYLHNDAVTVTVVKVHESDRVTVNYNGRNFSVKASNLMLFDQNEATA
jgi:hypothetical protein